MKFGKLMLAALTACGMFYATPSSAVVTTIYNGFTSSGDGQPFSSPVGTLVTPGITFGTDTGFNWHPFELGSFGAQSLATLNVATAGTYTFGLNSDDGSAAFIDGLLVVNNGNPHGPNFVSGSTFLAAGSHSLTVNFFECCGGASGLDFSLAEGVTFAAPAPAPGAGLLGFGALVLAAAAVKRRAVSL
jgi:hypothetical protein